MFPLRVLVLFVLALAAASLVEGAAAPKQRHARLAQRLARGADRDEIEDAVPEWRKYVKRMQKDGKEPLSLVRFASKRSTGWLPFLGGDDDDGSSSSSSSSASPSASGSSSASSSASSSSAPSSTGDGDGSGDGHTGQGTYYTPGLGSCGEQSSEDDMIVAVSHEMYDSKSKGSDPNKNPLCGKKVEAQYGSRRVQVKVVDRCTGCKHSDLDFSPKAFKKLASIGKGRLHGLKWKFVD